MIRRGIANDVNHINVSGGNTRSNIKHGSAVGIHGAVGGASVLEIAAIDCRVFSAARRPYRLPTLGE